MIIECAVDLEVIVGIRAAAAEVEVAVAIAAQVRRKSAVDLRVIVGVDVAVEVGVAGVGVFHQHGVEIDGLAVQRAADDAPAAVVVDNNTESRGVQRIRCRDGAGNSVAIP